MLISQYANEIQAAHDARLKLLVKGFSPSELQMLGAIVKLSQRRQPRIDLLDFVGEEEADVVMVDAADETAMLWAWARPWLARKVVIWVDADADADLAGMVVSRPIQWPTLPMLLVRAMEQVSEKKSPASVAVRNKDVLVVDDSLAVRNQLRALLEKCGLRVHEADCAETALQMVVTHDYACILLDVLMPGMDGYEACRRIKSLAHGTNEAKVVMLTSRTSPFDRIRGKMAGCDAYLTKPVNAPHLHEVISRFIAGTESCGAAQRMPDLQFAK